MQDAAFGGNPPPGFDLRWPASGASASGGDSLIVEFIVNFVRPTDEEGRVPAPLETGKK
jgi:hypothetical protein